MKKQLTILLFILLPVLISCQDKINFLPENPVSKYIVEGTISTEAGSAKVIVSQARTFADTNSIKGIENADVEIEHKGVVTKLTGGVNGLYTHPGLAGTIGETYHLTVRVNGNLFLASSTMPEEVPFLDFTLRAGDLSPTRATPKVRFKDAGTPGNYYWFQAYLNGAVQRQYKVISDEFISGQEISEYLVFSSNTKNPDKNFKNGDELCAEMHCIEAPVYFYLFALTGADGSGQGPVPGNPPSNITGGALGFFSAQTTSRKKIVL